MAVKKEKMGPPHSVGFTYNLKRKKSEEEAEFDSIETIKAIKNALRDNGCSVTLLEVNKSLPRKLLNRKFDIIFNIAEGVNGRSREAQVPALLELYNLKYTGSDSTTLCVCLDKALTKQVVSLQNIKTPAFRLVKNSDIKLCPNLEFPLIVKPNTEGSSKGISDVSIVENENELRLVIKSLYKQYQCELLIEEFIKGREFTVGILGNDNNIQVFRPMEIKFSNSHGYSIYDYNVKQAFENKVTYVCPASISPDVEMLILDTSRKIYEVLGCKDFSRIDFRLTESNELYFIEINPLPGLTPGYSDMPIIAEKNGLSYDSLIMMILSSALTRYRE
jgi:D-alanine-D-alanine ligase